MAIRAPDGANNRSSSNLISWHVSRLPFSRISAHVQEAKKSGGEGVRIRSECTKKRKKKEKCWRKWSEYEGNAQKKKRERGTWEVMVRI